MLKKLFNSDKKYYLELDEIKDSEVVQSAAKTAEKTTIVVKEKTSEVTKSQPVQGVVKTATEAVEVAQDKLTSVTESQPVQGVVKTATEAAEAAQDKLTSLLPTDDQPGDTNKSKPVETKQDSAKAKSDQNTKAKASGKSKQNDQVTKESVGKSKNKPNKQTQPDGKNSGASSDEPPFWVAAMYNNSSSNTNGNGQMAEQTFAPDNLMPTVSKYRRRPGGSLAKFKDMAKQARTPRRS